MIYARHQRPQRSLDAALSAVSPSVATALQSTHNALLQRHIPHVLIGGLAVGAHGASRSTDDVDYLVRTDDVFDGGLIKTFKPGVPIAVGKVGIDYLTPENEPPTVREIMERALKDAESTDEIVVIPLEVLVYMKLDANRSKDHAAIVELLKSGVDTDDIEPFLMTTGRPEILRRYRACKKQADSEM